jgi:hypothetical protein
MLIEVIITEKLLGLTTGLLHTLQIQVLSMAMMWLKSIGIGMVLTTQCRNLKRILPLHSLLLVLVLEHHVMLSLLLGIMQEMLILLLLGRDKA